MASHDSALKAHRQNVKRREHNRQLPHPPPRRAARHPRRHRQRATRQGQGRAPADHLARRQDGRRRASSTATPPAATSRAWRSASPRSRSRVAPLRSARDLTGCHADARPLTASHPHKSTTSRSSRTRGSPRNSSGRGPCETARRPPPAPAAGRRRQLFPHEPRELTEDHERTPRRNRAPARAAAAPRARCRSGWRW